MPRPSVAIGIAAYGNQPPEWWQHLVVMVAKFPHYGIEMGGILTAASMAADMNRNQVVYAFLKGKADYLLWIDTDNIIPFGGVKRLIETGKELVTGLYHLKIPPYTPIAYLRQKDDKGYEPIKGFRPGEIIPIDMAGLGACLVHRNVFETIRDQHLLLVRHNGSVIPIHVDDVTGKVSESITNRPRVHNSKYLEQVRLAEPNRDKPWPFHYLEYGRTEDVVFFEMAQRCGFQAYVDTGVECPHIGKNEITGKDYREFLRTETIKVKREREWLEIIQQEGLTDEADKTKVTDTTTE